MTKSPNLQRTNENRGVGAVIGVSPMDLFISLLGFIDIFLYSLYSLCYIPDHLLLCPIVLSAVLSFARPIPLIPP